MENYYLAYDSMDKKLEKLIPDFLEKPNIYIDAGAHDGLDESNTFFLEKKYNWRGLLIEPIPKIFQKCKENRSYLNFFENYALVDKNYSKKKVEINYCNKMSVLNLLHKNFDLPHAPEEHVKKGNQFLQPCDELKNKTLYINAIPLQKLLDKYNLSEIGLFSLDVEGFELFVLDGIDFKKTTIHYILIESWKKEKIIPYLKSIGFKSYEKLNFLNFLFSLKTDLSQQI